VIGWDIKLYMIIYPLSPSSMTFRQFSNLTQLARYGNLFVVKFTVLYFDPSCRNLPSRWPYWVSRLLHFVFKLCSNLFVDMEYRDGRPDALTSAASPLQVALLLAPRQKGRRRQQVLLATPRTILFLRH
jgi:hypothetical protein